MMDEKCKCKFCLNGVYELFCPSCGLNFNECQSKYKFYFNQIGDLPEPGIATCPKCISDDNVKIIDFGIGSYKNVT